MLLCNFPTTVLLVDDNIQYLNVLREMIQDVPIFTKIINNLSIAEYINNYQSPIDFTKFEIKRNIRGSDEFNVISNLNNIYKIVYEKRRFNTISAVILDYLMPGKTGKEILNEIKNADMKKVLLTSFLNVDEAIELMNSRIVDRCFNKYDRDFIRNSNDYIFSTIRKFFEDKVKFRYYDIPFLKNPFICRLIQKYIEEIDPTEYYVLDDRGSYMFVDSDANISGLLVYSDDDLLEIERELIINGIKENYYLSLHNRKTIPGFMYHALTKQMRERYGAAYIIDNLVPASLIHDPISKKKLYYAFVKNEFAFPLDKNKIVSYNKAKEIMSAF